MDASTRVLHESILRLLKGVLKAYEIWLRVQPDKGEPSIELPAENGKVPVR